MKRHIIRITALAGVLAVGWIAIAQAQRGGDSSSSVQSDSVLTEKSPKPSKAVGESNPLRPPNTAQKVVRIPPPPKLPAMGVSRTANTPAAVPVAAAWPQSTDVSASAAPVAAVDPRLADPFGVQGRGNAKPAPLAKPADVRPVSKLVPAVVETPRPLPKNQIAVAPLNTADGGRYATNNGPKRLPNNLTGAAPLNTGMKNTAPQPAPPYAGGADTFPRGPGLAAQKHAVIEKGPDRIAEGTGMPAKDRRLEGTQAPQLTIEKFAPAEIQVGNPANFRVVVRNTGSVIARGVEVRDQVPKGTRLIETSPRASRDVRGELVWKLDDMKPGEEKTVEAKLMPLAEGEIGSVATIHFNAGASVRTLATKPQLVVKTSAPKSVMIGEEVKLTINVSNPGSGVARGVVIAEQVPAGLQHPAGSELEYEIGDLKPSESRTLELTLVAARPGKVMNVLVARAEAGLQSKEELPLEIIAPRLKLAISGPKNRFLQRKTTYKLSVSNPGTAPARNVSLQAKLPDGLRFIGANNNGHYDPQTKTVAWALAELPVNETGAVLLTAMPEEIGEQKLTYRGMAEGALSVEEQKDILVDGIAAMRFEVLDVEDPVEKGGEAVYEIRVVNQGSKAGSNVRIQVMLPPSMKLVDAEGPSGSRPGATGNRIVFEPLRRLSPKVDTTYRVRVKCNEAGDQRISVQLQTDEMQSPVTKEESTRVFSDD